MYVAAVSHDYSGEKEYRAGVYEDCVSYVHMFFLGYRFQVINGKPWDPGNSSITASQAASQPNDQGFNCFSNVSMENDMVSGFMHCDGDGPCAEIKESN